MCVCVCVCVCLSPELIPYVLYNKRMFCFVKYNDCLMLMTFSLSVRTIKDPYFRANSGLNGSQSRDFDSPEKRGDVVCVLVKSRFESSQM